MIFINLCGLFHPGNHIKVDGIKHFSRRYMMELYEALQKNFKLITREEYRNCNLSNDTKKLLCDIGLPTQPLEFVEFCIDKIENIIIDNKYVVIGSDFETSICINSQEEIISVDLKNEYPTRFINKNLEAFLQCIMIFLSYEDPIIDADDETIEQVMHELRENFNTVDMQALQNEENWWAILLKQIEEGLI